MNEWETQKFFFVNIGYIQLLIYFSLWQAKHCSILKKNISIKVI